MAALASLDLAPSALAASSHAPRPTPSCLCLRLQSGHSHPHPLLHSHSLSLSHSHSHSHSHPSATATAGAHFWRPTARVCFRAAAAGQSEPGPGEPGGAASGGAAPSSGAAPRPGKRVLTNEERLALGLQPLKGVAPAQAEAQAPPRPVPTSSSQGASRGAPPRKNWTLLDQMEAEGFGYMAPDDNEWPLIRTARQWGEWLKKATGEDDEAKTAAMGASIMKVLLLVIFPAWLLLVLVAVGRLDLPPVLAEFQQTLRS